MTIKRRSFLGALGAGCAALFVPWRKAKTAPPPLVPPFVPPFDERPSSWAIKCEEVGGLLRAFYREHSGPWREVRLGDEGVSYSIGTSTSIWTA